MNYLFYGILFTHAHINLCSDHQPRIQYSLTMLQKIRRTAPTVPPKGLANIRVLLDQKK